MQKNDPAARRAANGAPLPHRKAKETHELSWLAVLLVGAWARTHDDGDDGVAQDGSHSPANKLTET